MKIEIKNTLGNVIYECEAESMKKAVGQAVKNGVSLAGADLWRADLSGLNLSGIDLTGADLSRAILTNTDLRRADLTGAVLLRSDLRGVCLAPKRGTWSPHSSLGISHDPLLHIRVARAALAEGGLSMINWHTCETTHCLAGWAVHLSGASGYALERVTSTSVAGAILCPEASHLFFASQGEALKWCREVVAKNEGVEA